MRTWTVQDDGSKNEARSRFMVIDYGVGNLQSVVHALLFLGCNVFVSSNKLDLLNADAYVLPGVGAFGEGIKNLSKLDLITSLKDQVVYGKKPFLGICLGMQLLAEESGEKGSHRGLGWIPGSVQKLDAEGLRLPHVGWNNVSIKKPYPLFGNIAGDQNFYFVHSYSMECDDNFVSATCYYGKDFVAAMQKDNILAAQFHPEKSQLNGLRILRNFVTYTETKF